MFKLSNTQIAALSAYKKNVTKDRDHVKSEVKKIRENLDHLQKQELSELCGYPDTDMRRLSSIHMKGELGLKELLALAQVTNHAPAFIAGETKDDAIGYTQDSVREFLSQFNMQSIMDRTIAEAVAADETEHSERFDESEERIWLRLLDACESPSKLTILSESDKILLMIKLIIKKLL